MLQEKIKLKRYLFLYEDYPLGQIQYDELKGIGKFTYIYSSDAPLLVKVKPETVVTLLEEIRNDAMDMKTIGEFERYVNSSFGNFHFKAVKGYE